MATDPSDDQPTQLETLVENNAPGEHPDIAEFSQDDLGTFKLIRSLGKGGMGQVFLARQTEPVDRLVALKLIARKVHNPTNLARFDIERQALAQMSHPAIAQVYDAGTTPSGYPYFAMEYVDGERLDAFCNLQRLTINERLALMARICHGVQHAHQRGIIHRDLKPANILVSMIDGIPSPKIIDFGIATATAADDPGNSRRDIVGTPQYMSPEQFSLDQTTIDTRSDVYSLGVILHELLIEAPPIDGDRLSYVDSSQVQKILADFRPLPTLSGRIGREPETDQRIAACRQTTPTRLKKRLRRDLDAIVAKALEQNREKRYASPLDLADDLNRALEHRPVSAVPSTAGYRLRRFARRNALAVGSASAILLALIAGLTAATLGMVEAQRQFRIAEQRQLELEQVASFQQAMLEEIDPQAMGLGLINSMREQVRDSAEREPEGPAGQIDPEMLETLVRILNGTDLARDMVDDHILVRARESIEAGFSDQPLLKADLYNAISKVYQAIGRSGNLPDISQQVLQLRQSALPDDHVDVLMARRDYGYALYATNQLDAADRELSKLVDEMESTSATDDQVLTLARNDLSVVRVDQGQLDEALPLARTSLEFAMAQLGPDDPTTIATQSNLGYVLARSGQIESALEQFQAALDGFRRESGPEHPRTLRAMVNVTAALGASGRYEEALELEFELLDILYRTAGRRHVITIRTMSNMANNLRRVDRNEDALRMLTEASELCEELYGPLDPTTLRTRLNLASLMTHMGRLDEGLVMLDQVASDRAATLGEQHPETLMALEVRTSNLIDQERYDEALDQIESVIESRVELYGTDHPQTLNARWLRGTALWRSGQPGAAVDDLGTVVEFDLARAARREQTVSRVVDLYDTYLDAGQVEQASRLRRDHLAWLEDAEPEELGASLKSIRNDLLDRPIP